MGRAFLLSLTRRTARGGNTVANQQQALLQRQANLQDEAKGIFAKAAAEGRDLTDAERARDDEIAASLDTVAADIKRHERARAYERTEAAARVVSDISSVTDRAESRPWGADWGAEKVLADARANPRQREIARNIALGDQLVAIYKARMAREIDPRLMAAAPGLGQNETIGPDGGYLLQQDVRTDLMLRVWGGQILSRVRRIPLSSGANSIRFNYVGGYSGADGTRHGGVRAYWLEEGATKTPSKLAFDFLTLTLHKIAALGYATDEVLQDVGALGALMFEAFADEIRFQVESAIFAGDGVGKPLGFANAANPSLITVAAEGGQAATTIQFENIAKMYMRMYPPSRANAVWFVNQDVEYQLSTMSLAVGVGGVPVWMPAGGISGAPNSTLYGRPVIPTDFDPTLGTVGDIVFADLGEYLYLEKGGIQTDSSIHVAFVTDETAFRAVLRCDGAPGWKSALTPAQGSNTTSPFVALATR